LAQVVRILFCAFLHVFRIRCSMSLECVKMPDWMKFSGILKARGTDFWISSLAGVSVEEMPDKLQTYRVEDDLAADLFTHCYFQRSDDIKAGTDAIIDEFGLGLRRKRVMSKSVPGCIFAFVTKSGGASVLQQRRNELASDDKRLSAEERLRRTDLKFDVLDVSAMRAEAKRCPLGFWLTSYTGTGLDDCKKKVVTTNIEGKPAAENFARCLVTEVKDCRKATEWLTTQLGLGLRKSAVRSRAESGCVALLLAKGGTGASAGVTMGPNSAASGSCATEAPETKRQRTQSNASGSSSGSSSSSSSSANGGGNTEPAVTSGEVLLPLVQADAGAENNAEMHARQVAVLEKRLVAVLPSLSGETLTTALVQERLEHSMQKPAGRLDKFRGDIDRLWPALSSASGDR